MRIIESLGRRKFIKGCFSAVGLAGLSLLGVPLGVRAEKKDEGLKLVAPEGDQMAKALKYTHCAKQSGARSDKTQLCNNCIHYTQKGHVQAAPCKGDKKQKVEVGKCNLIQAGMVTAEGWCASWVVDPRKKKG